MSRAISPLLACKIFRFRVILQAQDRACILSYRQASRSSLEEYRRSPSLQND